MGTTDLGGMQVEGMSLVIDDLVGSTGLELKVDPGVPYVYAGFAGLLLSRVHVSVSWSLHPGSFVVTCSSSVWQEVHAEGTGWTVSLVMTHAIESNHCI